MNKKKFAEAMSMVDDKYYEEAANYQRKKKAPIWGKWGVLAACLCLIAVIAVLKIANSHTNDQAEIPIQRPVSAYIQNDVFSVEVSHYYSKDVSTWTVDGEELDALREWTNGLQYEIIDFADEVTPDKVEGSELFAVFISEGDYPGFSYVIDSNGIHYLLIEGYWYSVTNPSYPPLTDKQYQTEIPAQRPISAYIQDDVSSVEVSHYYSKGVSTWTVDGEELDALREWANGLQYKIIAFADKDAPDKAEGSEMFSIFIYEGDYPGFSYIIDSSGIHYLLIEGYWYSVTNPSYPPLSDN